MEQLLDRAGWLCEKLDQFGVRHFRNPNINIVTIRAADISERLAMKYHLIADTSDGNTAWWKIVVMPHVRQGVLDHFISELKDEHNQAMN
jgi:hypothetical protein